VDTNRSAAKFVAIENDVVCLSAESIEIAIAELLFILLKGTGEGVVHGDVAVLFLVIGEKGEFGNPEEIEVVISFEEVLE
jgi:hypothetical protein